MDLVRWKGTSVEKFSGIRKPGVQKRMETPGNSQVPSWLSAIGGHGKIVSETQIRNVPGAAPTR